MSDDADPQAGKRAMKAGEDRRNNHERTWRVEEHATIGSTQTRARELPAWSAVIAGEQTAGRGQGERSFVSDRGGLYLSAVLPYAGDALRARGFALAVGWALCGRLRGFPEKRARMTAICATLAAPPATGMTRQPPLWTAR